MRIEALKYRNNNLDIIIFVDFDVLSGEHTKPGGAFGDSV